MISTKSTSCIYFQKHFQWLTQVSCGSRLILPPLDLVEISDGFEVSISVSSLVIYLGNPAVNRHLRNNVNIEFMTSFFLRCL